MPMVWYCNSADVVMNLPAVCLIDRHQRGKGLGRHQVQQQQHLMQYVNQRQRGCWTMDRLSIFYSKPKVMSREFSCDAVIYRSALTSSVTVTVYRYFR